MKKMMFFILSAAFLSSCGNAYDNIKNFATGETVYPGRYDTIIGNIGYERVELDLLKAGRLPASQIKLGKAKHTVVEYDDVRLEYDTVCSWVSVTGLTKPKLYRFSVYTTDEFGNQSVPQQIAIIPFTADDQTRLSVVTPRVIASPWAVTLSWTNLSSVLLDYKSLTYRWTDKDGNVTTGYCGDNPKISMSNLQSGHEASIDIHYKVLPKVDGVAILDTVVIDRTFSLYMPTDEEYQKALTPRGFTSPANNPAVGAVVGIGTMDGDLQISWLAVDNPTMQHTNVKYTDNTGVEQNIEVANTEMTTVLPGCKVGTPFYVSSNYKPEGVEGVYIDSDPRTYNFDYLDYKRSGWETTYTSASPATDGFPDGNPNATPAWNAHLDGNSRTMLSMAKPGKSVNGSATPTGNPLYFVLDLKTSGYVDYFRIMNRTTDTSDGLKVWAVQIFGTNSYQGPVNKHSNNTAPDPDPTNWEPMGSVIALSSPRPLETTNILLPRGYYRYIKVQYKDWSTTANSACQMAEFYLGMSKNPIIHN